MAYAAHPMVRSWPPCGNDYAPNGTRKACAVEHRTDFLLCGFRIVQGPGMPNIKIDRDVVVGGHFLDQRKHRARRLTEPEKIRMRGEEMDSFPVLIVFG